MTAGTPQTLAAVQAHQDPTTRSTAENLICLAHHHIDNPYLLINLELGPSGRSLIVIVLELDDLLVGGNNAPYNTLGHQEATSRNEELTADEVHMYCYILTSF